MGGVGVGEGEEVVGRKGRSGWGERVRVNAGDVGRVRVG